MSAYYTTPVSIPERVKELAKINGTLRKVSKKLKLSEPHLSRMKAGDIAHPSPATLKKLGLVKTVLYTRRKVSNGK